MNQNIQKVLQLGALIDRNNETVRRLQEENKQHMEVIESLVVHKRDNQRPSKKIEDRLVKQIKRAFFRSEEEYEKTIVQALKGGPPLCRADLVRKTHISMKTLAKLMPRLAERNVVRPVSALKKLSDGREIKVQGWSAGKAA